METIPLKQRTLVLVPFPFSNQSGLKVRPALIVSHDEYNLRYEDVVICAVTSQATDSPYSLQLTQDDMAEGELYVTSYVKADSLLKIDQALVIKPIGTIKKTACNKITKKIKELLS